MLHSAARRESTPIVDEGGWFWLNPCRAINCLCNRHGGGVLTLFFFALHAIEERRGRRKRTETAGKGRRDRLACEARNKLTELETGGRPRQHQRQDEVGLARYFTVVIQQELSTSPRAIL